MDEGDERIMTTPQPTVAPTVEQVMQLAFDYATAWPGATKQREALVVAIEALAVDAERLPKITEAIRDYHYALDTRQHGGVAMDRAFNTIEGVMDMRWQQGAEKSRRDAARTPATDRGELAGSEGGV